jgi:hypothetical protein
MMGVSLKGAAMKTIEMEITIPEDGILKVNLPPGAEPGDEIRVRLMHTPTVASTRAPLDLPLHHVGPWPENLSLRREEMYDDDGR